VKAVKECGAMPHFLNRREKRMKILRSIGLTLLGFAIGMLLAFATQAEPYLGCDPPLATDPPVEFHTVTGTWVSQTGTVAVPSAVDGSCHFDMGPAPIGINNMTISSCSTAGGCSDPRAFILYRTHGEGFTKDQKTFTIKEQWTVREGEVILQ
jgi:hypothetical protein